MGRVAGLLRGRLDPRALRDSLEAFALSRAVVFAVGAYAILTLDPRHLGSQYAPPYGARPIFVDAFEGWRLEGLWETLLHPLTQWDAGWYVGIAADGYAPPEGVPPEQQSRTAFFPLYPVLIRILGLGGSTGVLIVAAFVISALSLLAALYLLHRLTTIELGPESARPTILILAFFPTSFFLSAPYAESLFLALAVGTLYAGRTDRWLLAGVLAGLATASRSAGLALIPALLVMYLWGPRPDAAAVRERVRRFLPRYRLRPNVMWIALGLAGVVAFTLYLEHAFADGFRWVSAQEGWQRDNTLLSGTWRGAEAAVEGVAELASGDRPPERDPSGNDPFRLAARDVLLFSVLVGSLVALVGVARRMPPAYAVYTALALVPAVSSPEDSEALKAFSRYVLAAFPLFMWLGMKCSRPPWTLRAVAAGAVVLGLLTAQFATVQWVA